MAWNESSNFGVGGPPWISPHIGVEGKQVSHQQHRIRKQILRDRTEHAHIIILSMNISLLYVTGFQSNFFFVLLAISGLFCVVFESMPHTPEQRPIKVRAPLLE